MTIIWLVIISFYGGIEHLPMTSVAGCEAQAAKFNSPLSRQAHAYCIRND